MSNIHNKTNCQEKPVRNNTKNCETNTWTTSPGDLAILSNVWLTFVGGVGDVSLSLQESTLTVGTFLKQKFEIKSLFFYKQAIHYKSLWISILISWMGFSIF